MHVPSENALRCAYLYMHRGCVLALGGWLFECIYWILSRAVHIHLFTTWINNIHFGSNFISAIVWAFEKKKKGCTHRFPVFFFVDQKLSCLYTYIVAIKMIALLPSSPRCFHVFNAASALQDRKPVAWSAVWYSLCTTYSHEKKSHFLCLVLYSKDAKATGTTHYDLTCYNMNARLWWAVLGWIA